MCEVPVTERGYWHAANYKFDGEEKDEFGLKCITVRAQREKLRLYRWRCSAAFESARAVSKI